MQLGIKFKLWQDTVAIPEGAEWEGEIKRAISESVFFIPIVTPNSVASRHCRTEFEAFLDREQALGRKNLVFPLLYVRVPALEKEEQWRKDPLLEIIGRRQYLDWQKFRHRNSNDTEVAQRITEFCENIVESLQQPWISPADRRAAEQAEAKRIEEQARRDREEEAEVRQKIEQQRRAAEEAEAQRIAEQARLDQEEKKREKTEADTRRNAEWGRAVADKIEAQHTADQKRLSAEQERQNTQPRQESVTPPQTTEKPRTALIRAIALMVAALCGGALLYYLASVFKPADIPKPANAPNTSVAALKATPYGVGCSSFSTTHSPAGKVAAIVADDSAAAKFAMHSAQALAAENGYSTFTYVRSGLNAADVSSLLWQLQIVDLIIVCGPPDSAFASALKTSNIIR